MDEARSLLLRWAITRIHAAGLEITTGRTGRNFAEGVLAGKPDLDVIGLARAEAHVAGAERDGSERQAEPLQHLLGALRHALMLDVRAFIPGDRNELHLVELVLAQHSARVT